MSTTSRGDGAPPFLEIEGEGPDTRFAMRDFDAMPPFLMSLASDSDLWLFISSAGALTAGRRDADHALFPYTTDDRLHDAAGQAGPRTLVRAVPPRGAGGAGEERKPRLWEPFCPRPDHEWRITRTLRKAASCDRIEFEEVNEDLGLAFSYSWSTSSSWGFVREARLRDLSGMEREVEILDGLLNVMPAELSRRFQAEYSTLADGYREAELVDVPGGPALALFRLSSIPADRAEPNEALRANTVWCAGLPGADFHLLDSALGDFRRGACASPAPRVRGRRGAFLAHARLRMAPGGTSSWLMVADVGADSAGLRSLLSRLKAGGEACAAAVLGDRAASAARLRGLVASVDGLQSGADRLRCWRHYANALANAMRGGLPEDGYGLRRADFAAFLERASKPVASRSAAFVAALPERLGRESLVARARASGDPDLERLSREFLPLTFSRRHGDPSRPWNFFSIATRDAEGRRTIGYEGNWRDIFQNWEALALSHPGWLDAMTAKFLDSSTADGWNPYRITSTGFDWEVVDPDDDWSFIGYWGDHQAAYLLRLLEAAERCSPGSLEADLDRRLFSFARVPYRIRDYRRMLEDPKATVDFDANLHGLVTERARTLGSEGLLLHDHTGRPVRATLAEKLLVTILARLSNLVPGAGIWMNTQRPEWNDANNALVGNGASVVTLCQLRRLLAFTRNLLAGARLRELDVAAEIAAHARAVAGVLEPASAAAPAGTSGSEEEARARRRVMDGLGDAASGYRRTMYERGFGGLRETMPLAEILALLDLSLRAADASIAANRREDGLYHAYNLIRWEGEGVRIRRLPVMLEGQVAVLASGLPDAEASASLLGALRASALWREDQRSYLLYPDRVLPAFLERNNIPAERAASISLAGALVAAGDRRIFVADCEGGLHFSADLHNARELAAALDGLAGGPFAEAAIKDRGPVLDLYEEIFDHHAFTGRSGSFYKYEGLGSIYWHMVSKLLLAAVETLDEARRADPPVPPATIARLEAACREIGEGLGAHKSPAVYGAFPTDPYSHTPSFAGAQQPGLTGQVKEDLISRRLELGLSVRGGLVAFARTAAQDGEWHEGSARFSWVDVDGRERDMPLEAGTFALTLCQLPVVLHRGETRDSGRPGGTVPRIELTLRGGVRRRVEGLELDRETSASILGRDGSLERLDVFFPPHVVSNEKDAQCPTSSTR